MLNYKKRHPLKDKVLVDYQLVSAVFPTLLVGSTVGVMMNVTLPEVVGTVCYTILLLIITIATF